VQERWGGKKKENTLFVFSPTPLSHKNSWPFFSFFHSLNSTPQTWRRREPDRKKKQGNFMQSRGIQVFSFIRADSSERILIGERGWGKWGRLATNPQHTLFHTHSLGKGTIVGKS